MQKFAVLSAEREMLSKSQPTRFAQVFKTIHKQNFARWAIAQGDPCVGAVYREFGEGPSQKFIAYFQRKVGKTLGAYMSEKGYNKAVEAMRVFQAKREEGKRRYAYLSLELPKLAKEIPTSAHNLGPCAVCYVDHSVKAVFDCGHSVCVYCHETGMVEQCPTCMKQTSGQVTFSL